MGWNDHFPSDKYSGLIVTCGHCSKKYYQIREDQVIGAKSRDEDICPYCHKCNGSSMSVEFYNRPLEDN